MAPANRVTLALFALQLLACSAADSKTPYGSVQTSGKSTNVAFHSGITREAKYKSVGHKGITLWMTGISGSGKGTISTTLEKALVHEQPKRYFTHRLDADQLRFGLNSNLGFSPEDRKENVRRIAETAKLFAEAGAIVIATLVSPLQDDRDFARELHMNASLPFLEIFVDAPVEVAMKRDPKGLYKQAKEGKVKDLPGVDAVYERPENADVHLKTAETTVNQCVNSILRKLDAVGLHLPRRFKAMEELQTCDNA